MSNEPCSCDWDTGECQGPLGCKAFSELDRLRNDLEEWKQAAGVEAGLRREFYGKLEVARKALEEIGSIELHRVARCDISMKDKANAALSQIAQFREPNQGE